MNFGVTQGFQGAVAWPVVGVASAVPPCWAGGRKKDEL